MITDKQIDELVYCRNEITSLHSFEGLISALDAIDRVLRDVPIGKRPDVDALLARPPKHVEYVIVPRNRILTEVKS